VNALFLSPAQLLTPGGGGQQHCTREYHDTLTAAGFNLVDVSYETDRSPSTRLRRRFRPAPYTNLIPSSFFDQVKEAVRKIQPAFVFCNPSDFVSMGSHLRALVPAGTRVVFLSAGLASVDELHAGRIAHAAVAKGQFPAVSSEWIGRRLYAESEGLPHFDHVFCLAAFEVEICRWLGARSVSWLPRTIASDQALEWRPAGDRVGCVGTFDHPPNLEGLEAFCAALQLRGSQSLRVRLVTRSRDFARSLCSRYQFVDDLGALDAGDDLEREAATWSAFIHPIFCYAMGCSTKLATGLSWQIPVITTEAGIRGYEWTDGTLPLALSPADMVTLTLAALDPAQASTMREEVMKIVHSTPSTIDVANRIRRHLHLADSEDYSGADSQRPCLS
jgi:hypothetical protein